MLELWEGSPMGLPPLLDVLDEREERYEVIDGSVVVSPPARLAHGRSFNLLHGLLVAALPPGLELLGPEFAVRYAPDSPRSFLMPDLLVARSEDCADTGIYVAPLLVVEILSRNSRRRDRGEKKEIYAELGVPHYWLVDPEMRVLEVLDLVGGEFEATASGTVVDIASPFPIRIDLS